MAKREIYVSVDIETDGPIPGPHSMLSFGAVAVAPGAGLLGELARNLEPLNGASPHPQTEAFWAANPDAFAATRRDLVPPAEAMTAFVAWVEGLDGKPVFAAYPAGFDFTFMVWYMVRFAGRSPFSFSALDMKSYAMAKLGLPFRETAKRRMPKDWFSDEPHTHVALDDAREQAHLLLRMLAHRA